MSKLYDFKKAKQLIDKEKSVINQDLVSAYMGMKEDWSWTAEPVWTAEEGYLINFEERNWIGGIDGSSWATPVIIFFSSDESQKMYECWTNGEQERNPIIKKWLEEKSYDS